MVKIVSLTIYIVMLFFKPSLIHGHEPSEYVRYAYEARKTFIREMEKEYGWTCISVGTSVPYDIEELTASFRVNKKVSRNESRQLLVLAIERFRSIIHSKENLRPYLRYYPMDIHDAHVVLYFEDIYGRIQTDGSIVSVCNDWQGDIVYDAAKKSDKPGYERNYEFYRESYDEALKILGIEKPPHVSLVKKERDFYLKTTKEDHEIAKINIKLPSQQEELALSNYGPGDELKIVELSRSNFCNSAVEAIRELVRGIAEKYFDEAFFQRVSAKEQEAGTGEYIEYWPTGELKVKVQWKNGKPDGHMHGWYPNCMEAFKAYFKEGLKQGIHFSFFPAEWRAYGGSILRRYEYNPEGQLHGRQEVSYPGGRLKALVIYKNGVLDGKAGMWHAEGGCIREWKYKNGRLIVPKKLQTSK